MTSAAIASVEAKLSESTQDLETMNQTRGFETPLLVLPHAFLQAGLVGKLVMGLLAFASVWSWVLIAEGLFTLSRLKRALKLAAAGAESPFVEPILAAGRAASEIAIAQESPGELRQRIGKAMNRERRMC
jgi:hypothetical protein